MLLDDETYAKEIGILLTKYFNDPLVGQSASGLQDFEREYARGAEEVAANRMSESQKMMRDERVKISLDLLNLMRSGQYRPIYTSQDKGFRFDIFEMGVVQGEGGQPAIRANSYNGAHSVQSTTIPSPVPLALRSKKVSQLRFHKSSATVSLQH